MAAPAVRGQEPENNTSFHKTQKGPRFYVSCSQWALNTPYIYCIYKEVGTDTVSV